MLGNKTAMTTKSVAQIFAPPPPHWVGDGFKVHGFFPNRTLHGQRMSPFYLLDYNAKYNFPPSTNLLGVGPHPHRGFETVTIAYQGQVQHHDSHGGGGVIGQGDVQWMTAGSGVLHKEYHEEEFNRHGGLFQMVQLWVNLPAQDKMTAPKYQAITNAEMGRYQFDGGEVEVIAGEFNGTKGAATTFSPVHLYNVKAKKGASLTIHLPAHYTTALLVLEGQAKINQRDVVPTDNLAVFRNDGEAFTVAAEADSVLLVMSGQPLNEPIAAYGPFLMNTREEILQAVEDFQAGKFGYLED